MDNYAYYREVYGGTLTEGAFNRLSPASAAVLAVLLYPLDPSAFTGDARSAYQEALCRQVDYQSSKNGERSVSRETLGDYTQVYRDTDIRVSGTPLCPDALTILHGAHLIFRWI